MQQSRDESDISPSEYAKFMDTSSAFINQARRMEKAFAQASSDLDPLTGLHNRQAMHYEITVEHERAVRTNRSFSLAIADLDNFKAVNDKHGHAAGDRVLAAFADILIANVRPYDSVYRFGGEEFLIALPGADVNRAETVIERVRESLEGAKIAINDTESLTITGYFGVAEFLDQENFEDTAERADQALYLAKESGKNRVVRAPIP